MGSSNCPPIARELNEWTLRAIEIAVQLWRLPRPLLVSQKQLAAQLAEHGVLSGKSAQFQLNRVLASFQGLGDGRSHLFPRDGLLRLARIIGADVEEVEAFWRVATGRESFEQSEWWSCSHKTLDVERTADHRIVISANGDPFAIDHPDYSQHVHEWLTAGKSYEFIVCEEGERTPDLLSTLLRCYSMAERLGNPFRARVFIVSRSDFPFEGPDVLLFSPDTQHRFQAVYSGHPLGPGADKEIELKQACLHLERVKRLKLSARKERVKVVGPAELGRFWNSTAAQ